MSVEDVLVNIEHLRAPLHALERSICRVVRLHVPWEVVVHAIAHCAQGRPRNPECDIDHHDTQGHTSIQSMSYRR